MPMREDCKHFQSRTYASGEVARICELDLAPEAPWRCPENCPAYERRLADFGWEHGSLIEPAVEEEPEEKGSDIAQLLDAAEDVVNAVVPTTKAEVAEEQKKAGQSGWQRFSSRFRGNGRNRPHGGER